MVSLSSLRNDTDAQFAEQDVRIDDFRIATVFPADANVDANVVRGPASETATPRKVVLDVAQGVLGACPSCLTLSSWPTYSMLPPSSFSHWTTCSRGPPTVSWCRAALVTAKGGRQRATGAPGEPPASCGSVLILTPLTGLARAVTVRGRS